MPSARIQTIHSMKFNGVLFLKTKSEARLKSKISAVSSNHLSLAQFGHDTFGTESDARVPFSGEAPSFRSPRNRLSSPGLALDGGRASPAEGGSAALPAIGVPLSRDRNPFPRASFLTR